MGNYDDIINLPHHVSARHPQMSALDRAAQFSPFAALTGHEAVIAETARLTEVKAELDETRKETLNAVLQFLSEHIAAAPEIAVTYFVPDARKEGGAYLQITGAAKTLEDTAHKLVMQDGTVIPIDDIYEIECASPDSYSAR